MQYDRNNINVNALHAYVGLSLFTAWFLREGGGGEREVYH